MSVTVSGIMINPVGEPVVNAQITLTAIANSLTVLNTFSITVRTDGVGAYRIQLEEGSYSITVAVNGRSFVYGAVTLDNTTGPSTLNQLLKQQIMESELTPDVILYFRQIQQQVANDLATIKVLENSATDSAESAAHSRDEAKQYAADLDATLAVAKGYRDESGVSATAAAESARQAFESESSAVANANAAALSEANTLQYRNEAQSAAETAANDASTLAAEQTAEKITLAVKTDADRAEAARSSSEQIKNAIDNTAQQVTQQHSEALQAASAAKNSENNASASSGIAQAAAVGADQSKTSAAGSAETSQQNAVTTSKDKNAAQGYRDEAEGFANQARDSAESIDISDLEQQIQSKASTQQLNDGLATKASTQQLANGLAGKLDTSGGTMTGSIISRVSGAITFTPMDATAYNWVHWTQVDGTPGFRMGRLENNGNFYLRDYSEGGITALSLSKGQYILTSGNVALPENTPWLNATLVSGWTGTAKYRKVLGMVQLVVGISKSTTAGGDPIATLPTGYRPAANAQIVPFAKLAGGSGYYIPRIVIGPDGLITLYESSGGEEVNFTLIFPLQ